VEKYRNQLVAEGESIRLLATDDLRVISEGYSLFAENGVIVRNLNYRPWQWVYSISGCKSFPDCF
jgi:hypothetical protein